MRTAYTLNQINTQNVNDLRLVWMRNNWNILVVPSPVPMTFCPVAGESTLHAPIQKSP
jgi:hypothetical protein